MRTLKTREAASLLNVSPNTLRTWEQRYGCPRPLRSPGRHRAYNYAEIIALRDALKRGLSVESAVSAVTEGLGADTEALVAALDAFNAEAADRAMEASLALRSMERSVEEVLLLALDEIRRRDGGASARWAHARGWAVDWLRRARRFAPSPQHGGGVLVGDASGGPLGAAGPSIRALELYCRRSGVEVMVLPVDALTSLPDAIAALEPGCVVVAGGQSSDEQVGRWAYAVRQSAAELPIVLFLRPVRSAATDRSSQVLPAAPIDAHRDLMAVVSEKRRARRAASEQEAHDLAQPG